VGFKILEEILRLLDALEEAQQSFLFRPLSFIFPVGTKPVAMFQSPLPAAWREFLPRQAGPCQLHAGFDALVLQERRTSLLYISISKSDIRIKDARALWQVSSEDVGRIIRERETGEGKRSIIRIGPGGENLVKFASVCVDTYRHFGRLGLGAVFGSKNLKAVSVIGDRDIPIKDLKGYFKIYNDIYNRVTDTEIMSKYHDSGTPINIEPLNLTGGLPTLNLQAGSFEHADSISGEVFAEKNLIRKMACTGCPVGCIHIGQLRKVFDKGYEYESMNIAMTLN
jgi:aldehyde:ferredoxin oxidoreductase